MVPRHRRRCRRMYTPRPTRTKELSVLLDLSGLVLLRNNHSLNHPAVRLPDPGQTGGVASGISTRRLSRRIPMQPPTVILSVASLLLSSGHPALANRSK